MSLSYTIVPDQHIYPRINTQIDYQYNIIHYGLDNLYPQNMEEILKRSPITKGAVHILTDFLDGEGFESNGDKVINEFGQTWNDILHYSAMDYATFGGFGMHFNFNGAGNIIEVQHVPFEYIRLSLPDNTGRVFSVKVSNNWEEDSNKFPDKKTPEPVTFPLYNPLTAAQETIMGGNGQILYYTPEMWTYPLCTFDAVREASLTDAEIQTFMLMNIKNGFLGTTIFKYHGGFEDEEEKNKVIYKLNQFKGSYNANNIILAETPEDFTGGLIENVPANNQDRLFEQTSKQVRDLILQNYGMPPPLAGVQPEGGVFTQAAMRDSYIYYNTRTKNGRNILSRVFKAVDPSLGDILPNDFEYTDGALATQDNQFTEEAERSQEPEQPENG